MSKDFTTSYGGILENATDYPKTVEGLTDLFLYIKSRGGGVLSPITVSNYVNKLVKLNKVVTGKDYNGNLEWINDPKNVIEKIDTHIKASKKDFITPVIRLLKYSNSSNDTIAAYQKGLAGFKALEDVDRKQNKSSAKEQSRALPLKTIQAKIKDFHPENDAELVQKVLASFYFLNDNFTPRNDLYEMKLVSDSKKMNKMDPNFNYIVINKLGEALKIIMNNYKTRHTYGRVMFDLSPELKEILDTYLHTYRKMAGDYLFVMRDGSPFKEANFRNLIESSMEHIVGTPINIGLARKLKISDYFSSAKPHTIAQDEAFAKSFLHSTGVQKEYLKVDLFDKDD